MKNLIKLALPAASKYWLSGHFVQWWFVLTPYCYLRFTHFGVKVHLNWLFMKVLCSHLCFWFHNLTQLDLATTKNVQEKQLKGVKIVGLIKVYNHLVRDVRIIALKLLYFTTWSNFVGKVKTSSLKRMNLGRMIIFICHRSKLLPTFGFQ